MGFATGQDFGRSVRLVTDIGVATGPVQYRRGHHSQWYFAEGSRGATVAEFGDRLAVLAGAAFLFLYVRCRSSEPVWSHTATVVTGNGETRRPGVVDGSVVTLAPGTTLTYDSIASAAERSVRRQR